MIETCPICSRPLRNGKDSKQYIEYDPADRAQFDAGEIALEELNERAKIFYDRDRLCFNSGNENTYKDEQGNEHLLNPPCANFYAIRGGTIENPDVVVEVVKIEDN
jgi:hypothetical protein